MARGEITIHSDTTNVYKDGSLVGNIIGSKYDAVGGANKPTLKADNEWEMKDELVSMGYTIEEVRKTIRKPGNTNTNLLEDLGL